MPLEIVRNDITRMKVDAIVNAANNTLLGGGGVDGAIHRAAGPELLAECRTLGGCETGDAKVTRGYRLPCRIVIHTVGPVWMGGRHGEREQLMSCYRRSLALAAEHACETVAFPLISTGAYGYPKEEALAAATETIRAFLSDHDMTVYLVVFDRGSLMISRQQYASIREYIDDAYVGPDFDQRQMARRVSNRPPAAILDGVKYDAAPVAAPRPHRPRQEKPVIVSAEESLDDYLRQQDVGFRDMLLRRIDESGMTDAECYKRANVDRKLFSKIKNQPEYRPGKAMVLAFAVALRLPLSDTKDLLQRAGYSLTHSSRFDLIVEYFIVNGRYDVFEINEALFSFDERLLGSVN